jgi:hypothetical protein
VQVRRAEPVDSSGCRPPWRCAALAQSAERFTRNEQVVGSIPTGGSTRCELSSMISDQGGAVAEGACGTLGTFANLVELRRASLPFYDGSYLSLPSPD